jgi:hypothetical protein
MKYAQFFPLFHVKIHDLKYFILYCPVDVRLHYPFESGRLVITDTVGCKKKGNENFPNINFFCPVTT